MHDMQMARGVVDGYNLAIGEPVFLQECLTVSKVLSIPPMHVPYPSPKGHPALLDKVQAMYPGKHIVVANGAKQALASAMYALDKCYSKNTVVHEKPYWPSFPTIAMNAGCCFYSWGHDRKHETIIQTWPNNPNGMAPGVKAGEDIDIWDAVYATALYGYDHEVHGIPECKIMIESMSKCLGLSGLRLGWVVTEDPDLARYASQYVEITTSGVCVIAQEIGAKMIPLVQSAQTFDELERARRVLIANGELFTQHLLPYVDDYQGVPLNGTGMFAWFSVKKQFRELFHHGLKEAKVHLVSGDACGMTNDYLDSHPGWYRMSMGQPTAYIDEALTKLTEAMHAR